MTSPLRAVAIVGSLLWLPAVVSAQAFSEAARARVDYRLAPHRPALECAAMAAEMPPGRVSLEAQAVEATSAHPVHCRLTGVLAPEIAFEVSLPARWNGRFYMIGNGGHAGESLDDPGRVAQRHAALQAGFAFAQTNTGHDARREPGASFVMSDAQKAEDYAWRAVHLTATTAKALTARYYGRVVDKAYWNSCSNGGRQGLIEAQRFPEDFDGLVVNAPWVDQTGFTMGAVWTEQARRAAPLSPAKLNLLAAAVLARCDAVDGLADGLIDDPRRCDFDARRDVAACPEGKDCDDGLTPAQAETVNRIHAGPSVDGRRLFSGFLPGSEARVPGPGGSANSAWLGSLIPATPDRKPSVYNLAENTLRYLVPVPPQPDYDPMRFDFATDPPRLAAWGAKANALQADLAPFQRRGGRILMTYGWADQILQPQMGVDYYERVLRQHGRGTRDFFRLYMVPGMTHCAGGTGPDRFDPVSRVIDWVEAGVAPDAIKAARVVDGQVVRTRPLCPYPQVARYSGRGSIDDAANFRCSAP